MSEKKLQYWEVWYSKAAATGLLVARAMVDPFDSLILHAAPPVLTVEVRSTDGQRLAYGKDLEQTADTPMCRLSRQGTTVVRQDIWPEESDIGSLVLLPGGEAGKLVEWWHAGDQQEWRWQVEFYNTLR